MPNIIKGRAGPYTIHIRPAARGAYVACNTQPMCGPQLTASPKFKIIHSKHGSAHSKFYIPCWGANHLVELSQPFPRFTQLWLGEWGAM